MKTFKRTLFYILLAIISFSCEREKPESPQVTEKPLIHTISINFEEQALPDIDFIHCYMDLFNTKTQAWEKTLLAIAPFKDNKCELTVSSEKINKKSTVSASDFTFVIGVSCPLIKKFLISDKSALFSKNPLKFEAYKAGEYIGDIKQVYKDSIEYFDLNDPIAKTTEYTCDVKYFFTNQPTDIKGEYKHMSNDVLTQYECYVSFNSGWNYLYIDKITYPNYSYTVVKAICYVNEDSKKLAWTLK